MTQATQYSETFSWLRLVLTPGIGPKTAQKLLSVFGAPEFIFAQSYTALNQVVSAKQTHALLGYPDHFDLNCQKLQAWLEQSSSHHIISLDHPLYPKKLLETADPPLMLYAIGHLKLLKYPALAIVGSRRPTPQGHETAADFAKTLSQQNICIISGLATGIDGSAQEAAVDEVGSTIAVLGTGIDRVYPANHHKLAHKIAQHGLLLSEYPLGTAPAAQNFPKRNRIIAGLSLGTLVVEATLQSGSLITAKVSAEIGREVFAIPGSIHSPQSKGCHWLIQQGAKLVQSAQDIMTELHLPEYISTIINNTEKQVEKNLTTTSQSKQNRTVIDCILEAIGQGPTSFDAIRARTGLEAATIQAELLMLELNQQIARLPGSLFQRLHTAY